MNTISSSILALAIAAFGVPLQAGPTSGITAKALTYTMSDFTVLAGSKDAGPMFKGGDDLGDDDNSGHGGGDDDDNDNDSGGSRSGGHNSNGDSNDDNSESGSGRDKPRVPGGSGCDDLFDLIEHPECRA